ncbi:3-hydroxyacyl-CoA dehydrogenase NAD-binding domain-containing protein [Roseovarius amoyensis]|uniref:3-hydroxyacyl-CoA dehydrogenase NAD-binding domain-containing protein n=1 Tax=Roseovarius amoyensis TaxID=2211448 RepID=UPI000DBE42F2|nr:3-hydroxyacyl-CoA dehydrogenase NAD-binding domain-containing protein [Roseovarius amoyensis]
MTVIDYQTRGNVALVTMASPPVNALNHTLRTELIGAIDRAVADSEVAAIVLAGNEKAFSGGADITEFSAVAGGADAFTEPNMSTITNLIEACEKPVIAAISGACMGGGLELAMACHYRVGDAGSKVSMPEVNLGLLPGAGGTQRLPRLIGVEPALNMILSGKPLPREALADSGLFDRFVEGAVVEAALDFAREILDEGRGPRLLSAEKISYPYAEPYFQFVRTNVKRSFANYPAPLHCIDAVSAAVFKNFAAGHEAEWESFRTLLTSPVSQALRHGFFAERLAARVEGLEKDTPTRPVELVAVIGAGTMGGGIAMTFLNASIPVVLLETKQEALDAGLARIRSTYEKGAKRSGMSAEAIDARMAMITPVLDYAAIADADLVIEAVFEDLAVKKTVFSRLGEVMKPGAILATNTSTLDVDVIAKESGRPADVVGLHFFSPAHIMKLLEVVRGEKTAPEVLATAMALAKRLRKTPVVSRVCDGFIGNRMLNQYLIAAYRLIEDGVSPYAIDKAMERWGMAMGPFRMLDLAGNDVHWAVRQRQAQEDPNHRPAIIADALCEKGWFGQKSGRGWYLYEKGQRRPQPNPEVTAMVKAHCDDAGITPRKVASDEIVERLIYPMVNEGALLLEEGIAQRASDIDVVYLAGYGFPAFRGGPMFYADQVGLYTISRALAEQDIDPAPMIVELAADGSRFN